MMAGDGLARCPQCPSPAGRRKYNDGYVYAVQHESPREEHEMLGYTTRARWIWTSLALNLSNSISDGDPSTSWPVK